MHQAYTTEKLTGLLIIAALIFWRWAGRRGRDIRKTYNCWVDAGMVLYHLEHSFRQN